MNGQLIPIEEQIKKLDKSLGQVSDKPIIIQQNKNRDVIVKDRAMLPRLITIHNKQFNVSSIELMRMIMRLTQEIGDRKNSNDLISEILVPSLRSARGELVSALETYFKITWKIDNFGQSVFYR